MTVHVICAVFGRIGKHAALVTGQITAAPGREQPQ
jgi:hypothetical protein